ncbi:hypothetical protein MUO65_08170, partial [bacterium]|nr:hypothetical protein [bacterium]
MIRTLFKLTYAGLIYLVMIFLLGFVVTPFLIRASVDSPISVDLLIESVPTIQEAVRIRCNVSSVIEMPNTYTKVILPEGATFVSGQIEWQGDLAKDDTVSFSAIIKFEQGGNYEIKALSRHTIDEENWWGNVKSLYLYIGRAKSKIGFSRPQTFFKDEAASIGEGEFKSRVEPPIQRNNPVEVTVPPSELIPGYDEPPSTNKTAGTITVYGYFYYYDEANVLTPASNIWAQLWDNDILSADDYLGGVICGWDGYFSIGPVDNNDPEAG